MKKNTTDAKRLIEQAISSMPEDFTLSEARHHLKAALSHIQHVEQKRERREVTQKQNEINTRIKSMGNIPAGAVDLRENLKTIDDLIAVEQKKLDELVAKRQSRGVVTHDNSDDELIRD